MKCPMHQRAEGAKVDSKITNESGTCVVSDT